MGLKALVVGRNGALNRTIRDALACFVNMDTVSLAATGRDGLSKAGQDRFNMVLVDVDLPDMKCGTLLKTLMLSQPALKLVVTMDESDTATPAADVLGKHRNVFVVARPLPNSSVRFLEAIREALGAAQAPAKVSAPASRPSLGAGSPRTRIYAPRPGGARAPSVSSFWITAIAISTGGPSALSKMVPMLPGDYPHPILIIQHMPPIFTSSLARDLDRHSAVSVVEAKAGDVLKAGTVYIAPGGRHMEVQGGGAPRIRLTDAPPENSCRPSADVTYRSLIGLDRSEGVLALVMTGMGMDGCDGVRALKTGPCHCVTQSAESCAVYGMPRAVYEAGLSDESVDLLKIADRLARLAKGHTLVGA